MWQKCQISFRTWKIIFIKNKTILKQLILELTRGCFQIVKDVAGLSNKKYLNESKTFLKLKMLSLTQ